MSEWKYSYLHAFLTSPLDGGEWSASRLGRFNPDTHWRGGWVGTRGCIDAMAKRKTISSFSIA